MLFNPEKKYRIFRILCFALLSAAFLAVAGTAAVALKYRASGKSAEKAEIVQTAQKDKSGKMRIGENLRFSALVRIPWGRSIASFEVSPGKNSQLADPPSYERSAVRWGYSIWRFSAAVHAFRPGEISGGKMNILLEGGREKKQELDLLLPAFQAETVPVSEQDQLASAGKILRKKAEKRNRFAVAAVIAAAVLLLAVFLLLLRKKAPQKENIPAWMLALREIGAIRTDLHDGKADAAHAVAFLTDILRAYLERHFHLRAEHQTTREFLDELKRGGPLSSNQKSFLKEFLNSADMVKFAKLPADESLFDEAAERAEQLVRETSEADDNPDGKEHES